MIIFVLLSPLNVCSVCVFNDSAWLGRPGKDILDGCKLRTFLWKMNERGGVGFVSFLAMYVLNSTSSFPAELEKGREAKLSYLHEILAVESAINPLADRHLFVFQSLSQESFVERIVKPE